MSLGQFCSFLVRGRVLRTACIQDVEQGVGWFAGPALGLTISMAIRAFPHSGHWMPVPVRICNPLDVRLNPV